MDITPVAATPSPVNPAQAVTADHAKELSKQFLQLVVTQLRYQNPLAPQDGSQFLAELAQMSSLAELIQIRTLMEKVTSTAGQTAPPAPADPGAAAGQVEGAPHADDSAVDPEGTTDEVTDV